MNIRTVLFPMTADQDVLVMQSFNQSTDSWETMKMVSVAELTQNEVNELINTLNSNELVGQEYVRTKAQTIKRLQPTPSVVEATASDVSSEQSVSNPEELPISESEIVSSETNG